jgi:serine/threonine-protein kinase SRPK3
MFRKNRNVTVKIVVAEKSAESNHELQVLQHLNTRQTEGHPGREHVLHLLDSFYHEGPNGRHLCVVLDVLGPKVSTVIERCKHYRLGGFKARDVSRQLLLAVNYLHASGVAHGGKI